MFEVSLGSYADFGWFLTLKSVSDPFQSQIGGFGNELAKWILFEQSGVGIGKTLFLLNFFGKKRTDGF